MYCFVTDNSCTVNFMTDNIVIFIYISAYDSSLFLCVAV